MVDLLDLVMALVAGIALFFVIVFSLLHLSEKRWRKQELLRRPLVQEENRRLILELDVALASWLEALELPQLADQTKRQEAAHQLNVALQEKLLFRRLPD